MDRKRRWDQLLEAGAGTTIMAGLGSRRVVRPVAEGPSRREPKFRPWRPTDGDPGDDEDGLAG